MSKTKIVCIATEGATTDGRKIERVWLEQMAQSYNPKIYGARINLEHIKGLMPDSPFKRYGDVVALSTKDGQDGKLHLYAEIDPTDDLVQMVKARQKVYTSMEVDTKFADTGEAYLVGLAVTDDPASLGTEMLTFSAQARKSPLASRKTRPENLFTEAVEFSFAVEPDQAASFLDGFSNKIKALLSNSRQISDSNFTELQQAVELVAESQKTLLTKFKQILKIETTVDDLSTTLSKLQTDHSDLVKQLTSESATPKRTPSSGGSTSNQTDC